MVKTGEAPKGAELTKLVKEYFEKGGVIKVYPTRYATGALRSTLVSVKKQK